ncbi:hypothetical protein [Catalinimonas niigatensis]|uniref:hypothetical protein n=1 Tax=Catalinimonas niigatensis TaxID=1397264 RepID=UPI002666EC40|nr:hypothetical protein [Catalinimonas niigatensis]WPP53272.1 hypothetical protein PZB72_12905 [Catalinimonas niigatensis]
MLNLQTIRNYSYAVPLVYFTGIVLWMYASQLLNAHTSEPLVLLFCLPFLLQLWFKNRMLSVLSGMFMLLWSAWMLLAYASEYAEVISDSWAANASFILTGGGVVLLNFAMAIWLFPAEMGKAREEQQYQL